jgi:Fur family transcriptional regulator, ferric uptake regulator
MESDKGVACAMHERIEQIKKLLQSRQLKLTPQREATLQILLENQEKHLSAEEIFMLVKQTSPDIGLATVYRTLELLHDLRIIEKLSFGDGVARYEFRSDEHPHHHHHLICLNCGEVSEIEDLLDDLEKRVEREHDFQIVDHRVNLLGYCKNCKDKVNH